MGIGHALTWEWLGIGQAGVWDEDGKEPKGEGEQEGLWECRKGLAGYERERGGGGRKEKSK